MMGTMFANVLALYLAAMRATFKMACIFGFVLGGEKEFESWGGGGRVLPEEFEVVVLGVFVCEGFVIVAYEMSGVVCLFCLISCLRVLIMSFFIGQDPLTATCGPEQLQHLMFFWQEAKK